MPDYTAEDMLEICASEFRLLERQEASKEGTSQTVVEAMDSKRLKAKWGVLAAACEDFAQGQKETVVVPSTTG